MVGLVRRKGADIGEADLFDRLGQLFDDWTRTFPFAQPALFGHEWAPQQMIRVDQYQEKGDLVVRAELPGIDPDKDVELTVRDNTLHLAAERREEEKTEEKGYLRHELRVGRFARTLPIPDGVSAKDITASYQDGILEIHIPTPEPAAASKVPIAKG